MDDAHEQRRRRPRILGIDGQRRTLMSDRSDSAQGCRERAEADLTRADGDLPVNARRVLETSAKSWLARAELLDRLEKSFAARSVDRPQGD